MQFNWFYSAFFSPEIYLLNIIIRILSIRLEYFIVVQCEKSCIITTVKYSAQIVKIPSTSARKKRKRGDLICFWQQIAVNLTAFTHSLKIARDPRKTIKIEWKHVKLLFNGWIPFNYSVNKLLHIAQVRRKLHLHKEKIGLYV